MRSKRLDDALATLDIAVDLLEESATSALSAAARSPRRRASKGPEGAASGTPPSSPAPTSGTMGSLFSPEELTTVKQRLDDAIERLESVLETADDAR